MAPSDPWRERTSLEASTLRIEDLVRRVRDGKLTTPWFQRSLKWKDEDRRAFFDSILQGSPSSRTTGSRRMRWTASA